MKAVGKTDLMDDVADALGLYKPAVGLILDHLVGYIESYTAAGHRVTLRGFGTFEVKTRAPRLNRNPRTGEMVQVPEKRVLTFRPAKAKA